MVLIKLRQVWPEVRAMTCETSSLGMHDNRKTWVMAQMAPYSLFSALLLSRDHRALVKRSCHLGHRPWPWPRLIQGWKQLRGLLNWLSYSCWRGQLEEETLHKCKWYINSSWLTIQANLVSTLHTWAKERELFWLKWYWGHNTLSFYFV